MPEYADVGEVDISGVSAMGCQHEKDRDRPPAIQRRDVATLAVVGVRRRSEDVVPFHRGGA